MKEEHKGTNSYASYIYRDLNTTSVSKACKLLDFFCPIKKKLLDGMNLKGIDRSGSQQSYLRYVERTLVKLN
jgi:hypothetical protein